MLAVCSLFWLQVSLIFWKFIEDDARGMFVEEKIILRKCGIS